MTLDPDVLERCVKLRHDLHRTPELSNEEGLTAERIAEELRRLDPDRLATGVGGHGVLARFDSPGSRPGPDVLLRCELDGLPRDVEAEDGQEARTPAVAHTCGHDGHMASLVAVASHLARQRPAIGRVSLLFQPAEETGEGASRVLADPELETRPDFALAFHNLPGFPLGSVIVRRDLFAFGSVGCDVSFRGRESHAAEPEKGHSPVPAVTDLLASLPGLVSGEGAGDGGYGTVTHVRIGDPGFGKTPGLARVFATFRAPGEDGLRALREATRAVATGIAKKHGLQVEVAWTADFPPTSCDEGIVSLLEACAEELGLRIVRPEEPFRWSEDFGHFTREVPGAMFGLGAGRDHTPLHDPAYEFPDELVAVGAGLLLRVARRISSKWTPVDESIPPV